MKERKTLKKGISVAIKLAIFIVGFLVSWHFVFVPMNKDQVELCEQVAIEVRKSLPDSAFSGGFFMRVTEDFYVHVTISSTGSTSVTPTVPFNCSKVVARLKDGELITSHEMDTVKAVSCNTLIGLLFSLVYEQIVDTIKKLIKNRKNVPK